MIEVIFFFFLNKVLYNGVKERRKSSQFLFFNLMFLLDEKKNENEYLIYLAVKNQHNSSNGPHYLMGEKK